MSGLKILDSQQKRDRLYFLADTPLGKVLFYQFGETTQYKNLTNRDLLWSMLPTEKFNRVHSVKPIEIFSSERLTQMDKAVVTMKIDGMTYSLKRKKQDDGYIYVERTTDLRIFSKKEYPKRKFLYDRFHIETCKTLSDVVIKQMYTDEVITFNKSATRHSPYLTDSIADAVCHLLKKEEVAFQEIQRKLRKIIDKHQTKVCHETKIVRVSQLEEINTGSDPLMFNKKVLDVVGEYYPTYTIQTEMVDGNGEIFRYLNTPES